MRNHILIYSAGAHISKTYFTTVGKLNPTHVYIIYEKALETILETDTEYLKEEKPKILAAIDQVLKKGEDEDMRILHKLPINNTKTDTIRDSILEIRSNHPGAEFSFNITAGTTEFKLGLFLMAIWLEGRVCLTTNDGYSELPIPKMHLEDLNKDMRNIICALGSAYEHSKSNNNEEMEWTTTRFISDELGYTRAGSSEKISGANRTKLSRDLNKMLAYEHNNKGGLSSGLNLIEERGIGRKKEYHLLESGIYAWKMIRLENK